MIKKIITSVFLLFISFVAEASVKDVTVITSSDVENRLYDLEHKVKIIDNNQLNYKIEKDLLKDTYSNNYETISIVIAIFAAIFGVMAYVGFRDYRWY